MMRIHERRLVICTAVAVACLYPLLTGVAAAAEGKNGRARTWQVPVLMEEATVRGKVVVLETRREDRRVVKDLLIQVWTTPAKDAEAETPAEEKEKKLHESRTDENGFFALPVTPPGEYRLVIGELSLNLTVIPKDMTREGADQAEPKILLILLPKEVLNT